MSDMIRSFKGYTSFVYRIMFIIIFPVLLAGLTWLTVRSGTGMWFSAVIILYIMYESAGDYVAFSGICKKENTNCCFLKMSYYGERFFFYTIAGDLLRRALVAGILAVIAWIRSPKGFEW